MYYKKDTAKKIKQVAHAWDAFFTERPKVQEKLKQGKQDKNRRVEKEVMGGIQQVHTHKGQKQVLHLWKIGDGVGISCGSLRPEVSWWAELVFSRSECEWLLLQLQHQLRRKPIRVRRKTRARKSGRIVRPQRKNTKSRSRVVRRKD